RKASSSACSLPALAFSLAIIVTDIGFSWPELGVARVMRRLSVRGWRSHGLKPVIVGPPRFFKRPQRCAPCNSPLTVAAPVGKLGHWRGNRPRIRNGAINDWL